VGFQRTPIRVACGDASFNNSSSLLTRSVRSVDSPVTFPDPIRPSELDDDVFAFDVSAMKDDEEKARAAGCDHYVTKPAYAAVARHPRLSLRARWRCFKNDWDQAAASCFSMPANKVP
jgi:hypothetical protein